MALIETLKEANTQFPASKLVWVSIAVAAAVAVISGFGLGWPVLVFGSVYVVVGIAVYGLVALIYRSFNPVNPSRGYHILQLMLAYGYSGLVFLVTCLLVSCVFFERPRSIPEIMGAIASPSRSANADQGSGRLGVATAEPEIVESEHDNVASTEIVAAESSTGNVQTSKGQCIAEVRANADAMTVEQVEAGVRAC